MLDFLYSPILISILDHWKNHSLDYTDLCWLMSLLFNMLSRLVITFFPRSKCLLISWLLSPRAVILETPKIKSVTVSMVSPIYLPWSDGNRCHDLSFLNVWFKPCPNLSSLNSFISHSMTCPCEVGLHCFIRTHVDENLHHREPYHHCAREKAIKWTV